jgi:CHASE2 domain-containing sensor protein
MLTQENATGRRAVSGVAFLAAAATTVVQVVEGPAGSGYGWGAVLISIALVAVPLALVGWLVRTGERRFAWSAIALALLMLVVFLMALVGNWSGQSATDRVLDSVVAALVVATCAGTLLEEIPLLHRPAT